jgi:hypothetical protein
MPLFYFQVHAAGYYEELANEPLELSDLEEAWKEGVLASADLLRELDDRFQPGSELSVLVQDENRQTLRSIIVKGSD